jgi:hypothetical protein
METIDNKMEFEDLVSLHIQKLEIIYLKEVKNADNQRYAKAFYRTTLFENNSSLPKDSYFFDRLSRTFLHYYRMDTKNAIHLIFDKLNEIKDRAEQELVLTNVLQNLDQEDEALSFSFEEEQEYNLILLDYPDIYDLLAYFLATRKLCDKYPEDKEVKALSIKAPLTDRPKTNRKQEYSETFSVNLQLLAIHFFLLQVGIIPRVDSDLKPIARMAHLLSNKGITDMDNSGLYSSAKKLFNKIDGKKHLKDLKRILPFFDKLNFDKASNTIKNEIEYIEKNFKK